MEPRNPERETPQDALARSLYKAQIAYQFALRRLEEKLLKLDAVRKAYKAEAEANGWHSYPPLEGVTDVRNSVALVVDDGLARPTIGEVASHFNVGRSEAEAIIDFAETQGDDLRAVILRGWHR